MNGVARLGCGGRSEVARDLLLVPIEPSGGCRLPRARQCIGRTFELWGLRNLLTSVIPEISVGEWAKGWRVGTKKKGTNILSTGT